MIQAIAPACHESIYLPPHSKPMNPPPRSSNSCFGRTYCPAQGQLPCLEGSSHTWPLNYCSTRETAPRMLSDLLDMSKTSSRDDTSPRDGTDTLDYMHSGNNSLNGRSSMDEAVPYVNNLWTTSSSPRNAGCKIHIDTSVGVVATASASYPPQPSEWSYTPYSSENSTLSPLSPSAYSNSMAVTNLRPPYYSIHAPSAPQYETRQVSPSSKPLSSPFSPRHQFSSTSPLSTPSSHGDLQLSASSDENSSQWPPSLPQQEGQAMNAPADHANVRLCSHREQAQFFKDALILPGEVLPGYSTPGPFIPQPMYKPHTDSDRRRYVNEVDLDEPIYFWTDKGICGITLSDALLLRVKKLHKREELVFEGRGPSVSIRLEWPGYRQWSRQIPTKDFRSPPGPITRAKLVKNVAKCVQRFIQEKTSVPMEEDGDRTWKVGPGHINFDDLILVSLHHVSMGSWQPHLRLRRPI